MSRMIGIAAVFGLLRIPSLLARPLTELLLLPPTQRRTSERSFRVLRSVPLRETMPGAYSKLSMVWSSGPLRCTVKAIETVLGLGGSG